jgi:hypothetical protein
MEFREQIDPSEMKKYRQRGTESARKRTKEVESEGAIEQDREKLFTDSFCDVDVVDWASGDGVLPIDEGALASALSYTSVQTASFSV